MHVRGMDFVAAVQNAQQGRAADATHVHAGKTHCPAVCTAGALSGFSARRALSDRARPLPREVIDACLQSGDLYESLPYHNAVFVGRDAQGVPRYAMQRSTEGRPFKLEAAGSDKRFTFSIPGTEDALAVTEGAIDALSVATLFWRRDGQWRRCHYLSLGRHFCTTERLASGACAVPAHTWGSAARMPDAGQ